MAEKEAKVEKKAKPAAKKTVKKTTAEKKPAVKKEAPAPKKTAKKEAATPKKTVKKADTSPAKPKKATEEKSGAVTEKKKAPKKKAAGDKVISGKIKPVLDDSTRDLLDKREERAAKQPKFRRNEWFRYKKLGESWKRPRGVTNKTRLKKKYRAHKVRIGFGKPADVRGYHPSGFKEVLVHNLNDIEGIDPKIQAIRIGATVGTRKRRDIVDEADKKKIRVLNRGGL